MPGSEESPPRLVALDSDSDSQSDSEESDSEEAPPRLVALDSDSDSQSDSEESDSEEAPPRLVALDVEVLALQRQTLLRPADAAGLQRDAVIAVHNNMERAVLNTTESQSRGAPHTHCRMLFGACAGNANEP